MGTDEGISSYQDMPGGLSLEEWQRLTLGEPLSMVYTLPVIDDDGYVTGKRGKVIAPSEGLVLRALSAEAIEVGECSGSIPGVNAAVGEWRLPGGQIFRLIEVTAKRPPARRAWRPDEQRAFTVWQRVR